MSRSYKDKLINFEVQPPSGSWENIAQKLAEEQPPLSFSDRLFNYESVPPQDAWNNIEAALKIQDPNLEKIVPITSRRPIRFLQVAIAAAMLGVAIVGILYFNKQASRNNSTVATSNLSSSNKVIQQDNSVAKQPSIADDSKDILYEEVAVNKPSRNHVLPGRALQNAKVQSAFLLAAKLTAPIEAKPIRNAAGDIIKDPQVLNDSDPRYIDITSPSGQQTKISSKFLNMVMFLNDDNDVDQVTGYFDKDFLESLTWKSRFRDWRNKIITTSFVPSSTNFMDILEFRDLIQKDK